MITFSHPRALLIRDEAANVGAYLRENSVDSWVTDPPAGIAFMGKGWDKDHGGRDGWIAKHAAIFAEAFRVLKPGAHGLVWALPRTSHWTATALENAGFEIRDVHLHLFGTGFPKSLNVGEGRGTALKPAAEHWILVRKPMAGTVAANVLEHGTGALNIDACRIGDEVRANPPAGNNRAGAGESVGNFGMRADAEPTVAVGRWPAHVSLDEEAAAVLDEQSGTLKSGAMRAGTPRGENAVFGKSGGSHATDKNIVASKGGASRFFHNTGASCLLCGDVTAAEVSSNRHGQRVASALGPAQEKRTGLEGSMHAGDPSVSSNPSMSETASASSRCVETPTQTPSSAERSSLESRHTSTFPLSPAGAAARSTQTDITRTTLGRVMCDSCVDRVMCASTSRPKAPGDPGEANRFLYVAKGSRSEKDLGCEHLPPRTGGEATDREEGSAGLKNPRAGAGRTGGARNHHPTVKSIALMRWLVRLITPPGGLVLDTFMGSGSTGVAALAEGCEFVGIERDIDDETDESLGYMEVARARIEHALKGEK